MDEFCSEEYSGLSDDPLLDVEIVIDGEATAIEAYLDTGCSTGISLTQNQVTKLGLPLPRPMNSSPNLVALANNTLVPSYDYLIKLRFRGEEVDTTLSVLHTSVGDEFIEQTSDGEPSIVLLGREVMDDYLVKFDGLARPTKKFTFSK